MKHQKAEGGGGFKETSQNIQKEVEEMSVARVINMLQYEATGNLLRINIIICSFYFRKIMPSGFTSSIKCMRYF